MREKPYRSQLPENVVKWLKRRRNRMNIIQKIRFVGRLNNTIKSRTILLNYHLLIPDIMINNSNCKEQFEE